MAAQCKPFLKKFQTQTPLVPYLYDRVVQLLRILMKQFVRKSIMEKANTVVQLLKTDVTSKDTMQM